MDVLDVNIFGQVRDLLRVELVPDETGRGQLQSGAPKVDETTTKAPPNDGLFNMYLTLLCQKCILINDHLDK